MYTLNGWWFLSSGGAYPPVFTVDADNLDDEANVPTNTATPTIEMDGEGGESTTTDEITNTDV